MRLTEHHLMRSSIPTDASGASETAPDRDESATGRIRPASATAPMNRVRRVACAVRPGRLARLVTSALAAAASGLFATAGIAAAQGGGLGTGGFRNWLLDNMVPLGLLVVALLLLWLGGGRGENSQVMRRLLGVLVALAVLGLAVTDAGKDIGTWLANLFRA